MADSKTKNKQIAELSSQILADIFELVNKSAKKEVIIFDDYQKMLDDDYDEYMKVPGFNSDHTYPDSVKKVKRVYLDGNNIYVEGVDEDRLDGKGHINMHDSKKVYAQRLVQMDIDNLTIHEQAEICDYLNTLAL